MEDVFCVGQGFKCHVSALVPSGTHWEVVDLSLSELFPLEKSINCCLSVIIHVDYQSLIIRCGFGTGCFPSEEATSFFALSCHSLLVSLCFAAKQ